MACCGGPTVPTKPPPKNNMAVRAPAPSPLASPPTPVIAVPPAPTGVHKFTTSQPLPQSMADWSIGEKLNIRMSKHTYAANAPNEDRSTLAVDMDFKDSGYIFAGVWDGHAGFKCSEFVDQNLFQLFQRDMAADEDASTAFKKSMTTMDERYILESEAANDVVSMCCGTCAVAACIELPDPHDRKQQVSITVGNLGDSRVVCGKFKNSLFVEALSEDHSIVSSVSERNRLKQQFPHVDDIMVLGDGDAEEHGTVLGLCRFTRSIGDCHTKSAKSADAFNTWHAQHKTGLNIKPPQDPTTVDEAPEWTLTGGSIPGMYISNDPDVRETTIQDGFVIVACDGIWDEMDNDEAAHICAKILVENQFDSTANIAQLFIDEVMKSAAQRIREEYEEEADMTLADLLARKPGKHPGGRSLLHDDMTVIVIDVIQKDKHSQRAGAIGMANPIPKPIAPKTTLALEPEKQDPASPDNKPGMTTPMIRGMRVPDKKKEAGGDKPRRKPKDKRQSGKDKRRGSVLLSRGAAQDLADEVLDDGAPPELDLESTRAAAASAKGAKKKKRKNSTVGLTAAAAEEAIANHAAKSDNS